VEDGVARNDFVFAARAEIVFQGALLRMLFQESFDALLSG
jgi:hypothetical protein